MQLTMSDHEDPQKRHAACDECRQYFYLFVVALSLYLPLSVITVQIILANL